MVSSWTTAWQPLCPVFSPPATSPSTTVWCWGSGRSPAKQGEVAAINALGGDERLVAEVPACILKGAGIELSSIGRVEPEPGDELVVIDNPSRQSYRRMVISDGRLVGGLVLGHHPEDFSSILAAVKKGTYVGDASLAALRAGDMKALKGSGAPQPAS